MRTVRKLKSPIPVPPEGDSPIAGLREHEDVIASCPDARHAAGWLQALPATFGVAACYSTNSQPVTARRGSRTHGATMLTRWAVGTRNRVIMLKPGV